MDTRLAQLRRLGGDKLVGDLINLFLESAPQRLETIRVGLEAGDLTALGRAAHSLTSSAGNLGAVEMQTLAAALEEKATAQEKTEVAELFQRLQTAWLATRTALEARRSS